MKAFWGKLSGRSAQGLVEYTLILLLVILVCIIMLKAFGGGVNNSISGSNSSLTSAFNS